jgi:hypothetical protein
MTLLGLSIVETIDHTRSYRRSSKMEHNLRQKPNVGMRRQLREESYICETTTDPAEDDEWMRLRQQMRKTLIMQVRALTIIIGIINLALSCLVTRAEDLVRESEGYHDQGQTLCSRCGNSEENHYLDRRQGRCLPARRSEQQARSNRSTRKYKKQRGLRVVRNKGITSHTMPSTNSDQENPLRFIQPIHAIEEEEPMSTFPFYTALIATPSLSPSVQATMSQ